MSRQPSASYTRLLLACPRPFDPALPDEPDLPGESARYGSAFHRALAACLESGENRGGKRALLEKTAFFAKVVDKAAAVYNVKAAAQELAGHVKSTVGVLRNWLEREKLEIAEVETAYAIKPTTKGTWAARPIPPHDADHKYDVRPGEVPGTVDLIARSADRKRLVVVDHKTGSYATTDFARPSQIPQMKTLGLLGGGVKDVEVGIFHADRLGLPTTYAELYEGGAQMAHATELAHALELIGHGYLRTGAHCGYCPARALCPAHRAELISESTEVLVRSANAFSVEPIVGPLVPAGASKLTVEERAGFLYEVIKKFEKLAEAGRDEIKRLVREGAIIETGGKTLAIREQTYETLSMKSVREALGQVEGEKMIAKLRKKGAVRESTRQMLVGEK